MVTVAVVALLGSVAVWAMGGAMASYRASAAAQRLVTEVRRASAIAARTNGRVLLEVDHGGDASCNPSIVIRDSTRQYERICMNTDYPGVAISDDAHEHAINCDADAAIGLPALPACSLCSGRPNTGDWTNIIRVLPSGETFTPGAATGATIVFAPEEGASRSNTFAVGVRQTTGRVRHYRPAGAGTSWECP